MNDENNFRKELKKKLHPAGELELSAWKKAVRVEARKYQKNIIPMQWIPLATAASIGFLIGALAFKGEQQKNMQEIQKIQVSHNQENLNDDATEEIIRIND